MKIDYLYFVLILITSARRLGQRVSDLLVDRVSILKPLLVWLLTLLAWDRVGLLFTWLSSKH